MIEQNDVVLGAYSTLANAVSVYISSHFGSEETSGVVPVYDAICNLGSLYGADLDQVAVIIRESNDLPGKADSLRGDPLVLVRLVGTLSQNLADISACVYDPDTGLQVIEVLGSMLGTVLTIQEYEDA